MGETPAFKKLEVLGELDDGEPREDHDGGGRGEHGAIRDAFDEPLPEGVGKSRALQEAGYILVPLGEERSDVVKRGDLIRDAAKHGVAHDIFPDGGDVGGRHGADVGAEDG